MEHGHGSQIWAHEDHMNICKVLVDHIQKKKLKLLIKKKYVIYGYFLLWFLYIFFLSI